MKDPLNLLWVAAAMFSAVIISLLYDEFWRGKTCFEHADTNQGAPRDDAEFDRRFEACLRERGLLDERGR